MLIAIDGPAGAGKSTVARALARELGFAHLDSGAMYRCVGLLALASPHESPAALARAARIELGGDPGASVAPAVAGAGPVVGAGFVAAAGPVAGAGGGRVLLDGRDVTDAIRSTEVSQAASRVAADPGVREALVAVQRELIARGDWVAEGRDIGTVVAPDAQLKVFLTADAAERARRRAVELGVGAEDVIDEQARRDERDSGREHSPLRPAPGGVTLDTTGMSVGEVVGRIVSLASETRTRPAEGGLDPQMGRT
jgi:CMP/dCMP kinase